MTPFNAATGLVPVVLQGARGALSAFYYAPPEGCRTNLLLVPSFAEEMNRCRSMVAMQARALAGAGVGTLVLDPFGTGDSAGEFAEADWATWITDLQRGVTWLRAQPGGCSGLWAIRAGALLAAELVRQDEQLRDLLLWQPVVDGKSFYTQLLRVRIAADMHLPDRVKTTAELRALSASGQVVQVSGYNIGPSLAADLDRQALRASDLTGRRVQVFEVLPTADATPSPATVRWVEAASGLGVDVRMQSVTGPPFWAVHEREVAPDLIDATTAGVRPWIEGRPTEVTSRARQADGAPARAERPLTFACGPDTLSGVLHAGQGQPRVGVVIIVAGGPQYRAGAHRQWVSLARGLARAGATVLRFDLRGMGDSTGEHVGYQQSDADIRAAVDALVARTPGLDRVVLVGECESASGILFYSWRDARVSGAVLVNPWVRTEEGRAQVIVKSYYLERLRSPEFWRHVRSGQFKVVASLTSMVGVLRAYVRGRRQFARARVDAAAQFDSLPLPLRTAEGLRRFAGPALLLMSGRDFIAQEFDEVVKATPAWSGLLADARVTRIDIEGADHTFSKDEWKQAAAQAVTRWVMALAPAGGR